MSYFNQSIKIANEKTNMYDLGYRHKTSFKMGRLVPIFNVEVLPNDTIEYLNIESFVRAQAMLAPVMHDIEIDIDVYYEAYRNCWDKFDDWIFGRVDGLSLPTFGVSSVAKGTLANYLGMPTFSSLTTPIQMVLLDLKAYQRIFHYNYRNAKDLPLADEDDILSKSLVSGINPDVEYGLQLSYPGCFPAHWKPDYFTTALYDSQDGNAVTIPTQENATIRDVVLVNKDTDTPTTSTSLTANGSGELQGTPGKLDIRGRFNEALGTIRDLRVAHQLQKFLEITIAAGSRYADQLYAHWGIKSRDARLQRPEFLGRFKSKLAISEVVATAQNSDTPLGDLAGKGTSYGRGQGIKFTVPEHGTIMALISVRPKTAYINAMPKKFLRTDRFEFAHPAFANVGDSPIMNWEVAFNDTTSGNPEVFGWTEPYAEYKMNYDIISGDFIDDYDHWHFGIGYGPTANPVNNESFTECIPSTVPFVFSTQDGSGDDNLLAEFDLDLKVRRAIPYYGNSI